MNALKKRPQSAPDIQRHSFQPSVPSFFAMPINLGQKSVEAMTGIYIGLGTRIRQT